MERVLERGRRGDLFFFLFQKLLGKSSSSIMERVLFYHGKSSILRLYCSLCLTCYSTPASAAVAAAATAPPTIPAAGRFRPIFATAGPYSEPD